MDSSTSGCWYLGLPSPSPPGTGTNPAGSIRLNPESEASCPGQTMANMSPSPYNESPSRASGCRMLIEPRKRSNPPAPKKATTVTQNRVTKRKRVSQIALLISEEAMGGPEIDSGVPCRVLGGLSQSPRPRSPYPYPSPTRLSGASVRLNVSAHTRKRLVDYLSPKMKKTCLWQDENELATLLNGTKLSKS